MRDSYGTSIIVWRLSRAQAEGEICNRRNGAAHAIHGDNVLNHKQTLSFCRVPRASFWSFRPRGLSTIWLTRGSAHLFDTDQGSTRCLELRLCRRCADYRARLSAVIKDWSLGECRCDRCGAAAATAVDRLPSWRERTRPPIGTCGSRCRPRESGGSTGVRSAKA